MLGIEAFLEILAAAGVRYIFGNPGSTELPLNNALAKDSAVLRIVCKFAREGRADRAPTKLHNFWHTAVRRALISCSVYGSMGGGSPLGRWMRSIGLRLCRSSSTAQVKKLEQAAWMLRTVFSLSFCVGRGAQPPGVVV